MMLEEQGEFIRAPESTYLTIDSDGWYKCGVHAGLAWHRQDFCIPTFQHTEGEFNCLNWNLPSLIDSYYEISFSDVEIIMLYKRMTQPVIIS